MKEIKNKDDEYISYIVKSLKNNNIKEKNILIENTVFYDFKFDLNNKGFNIEIIKEYKHYYHTVVTFKN